MDIEIKRNTIKDTLFRVDYTSETLARKTYHLLKQEFPREWEKWRAIEIHTAYEKALKNVKNKRPRELKRKMHNILVGNE